MGICGKAEMSKKPKIKQTFQTHGQGLGRDLAGDMGLIYFILFLLFFIFLWFFTIWSKSQENRAKNKSDPWARSGERPGTWV